VRSTEGEGTTVELTLPLAGAASKKMEQQHGGGSWVLGNAPVQIPAQV